MSYDFSDRDLRGRVFSNENLREADFSGALLHRAVFSHANLVDADFSRAKLNQACLFRADLTGANLTDANLSRANLDGAILRGVTLSKTNFTRAILCGADTAGFDRTKAQLTGANVSRTSLDTLSLALSFRGQDLSGRDFRGADFGRADFREAKLVGADFKGAHLHAANFSGADLTRANLTGTKLAKAIFAGAVLTDTCLDPLAFAPPATDALVRSCGLEPRDDGFVYGYRTRRSMFVDNTIYDPRDEPYVAPVFSVDPNTRIHPGIHFQGPAEASGNSVPIVRVKARREETLCLGSQHGARARRIWVLE